MTKCKRNVHAVSKAIDWKKGGGTYHCACGVVKHVTMLEGHMLVYLKFQKRKRAR